MLNSEKKKGISVGTLSWKLEQKRRNKSISSSIMLLVIITNMHDFWGKKMQELFIFHLGDFSGKTLNLSTIRSPSFYILRKAIEGQSTKIRRALFPRAPDHLLMLTSFSLKAYPRGHLPHGCHEPISARSPSINNFPWEGGDPQLHRCQPTLWNPASTARFHVSLCNPLVMDYLTTSVTQGETDVWKI